MKCSICNKSIKAIGTWTQGNNAEPINSGRCCDKCNAMVVIPERIKQLKRTK
jgi:hypothetical protein